MSWCKDTETILCYDNAYSEMTFDDYVAPSYWSSANEAIRVRFTIKTFNMTGYRMGYAVSDATLVAGLRRSNPR